MVFVFYTLDNFNGLTIKAILYKIQVAKYLNHKILIGNNKKKTYNKEIS